MLELMLALIVSAMIGFLALQEKVKADRMEFATVQGGDLALLRNAADAYASENFAALQKGANVTKNGVTLAAGTDTGQSYAPTVGNLRAMGYLPAGFTNQSTFSNGQAPGNYQVIVRRTPIGCAAVDPASCDVTGIVYIDQAVKAAGSTEIDGPALTAMLTALHEHGGISLPTNPAQVIGANAGWADVNPVAGQPAGVIAARFGFMSSGLGVFVRRNDTRDPNLQGTLTVAGDVTGKSNVGTNDGLAACLRAALLSDGQIIARAANCIARATINPNTGTIAANDATGAAQVTLDGGTGSMTASGQIAGASANLTNLSTPGTSCTGEGDIVRDSTSAASGLLICRARHYVSAAVAARGALSGDACIDEGELVRNTAAGSMGLLICRANLYRPVGMTVATAGTACAPDGALAQDGPGSSLICQSGTWIHLASRMGNYAYIGAFEVTLNNTAAGQGAIVNKPTCLANGTPKIYLLSKSDDQIGFINRYATDGGSFWQAFAVDGAGNPVVAVMIAQTYCYYT